MKKVFNKPDLNAPRYIQGAYNVTRGDFFKRFREKHPRFKDIPDKELKSIIKKFNELFVETVIDTRDGVRLPEELGNIFIGTCQTSKKTNIDFGKSIKYGYTVSNNNWDTDGKLGKIFYTNDATKYKFINRECWAFVGCRNFKRNLAKVYPETWMNYIRVDPMKKIRKMFQANILKDMHKNKETYQLKTYNEFDL
jgi:hypothetical protein